MVERLTSLVAGTLAERVKMPTIKYVVKLTAKQRQELIELTRRGKHSARKIARARILLKAEDGLSDEQIAEELLVGSATVGRIRQRFATEGFESSLGERPRPGRQRKLSPKQEAHLIATACSATPEGHARWTLRLLADRVVELGFAETCSYELVRRALKKTNSSRGKSPSGASRK